MGPAASSASPAPSSCSTAATLLFRAPRDTRTLDVADEAQVRALLRDFGDHDSLGYFATRRDKSVVWDTGDPAHGARRASPTG